ncbi:hypothetical protein O5D80_007679 [Batrachochytrium dendrobatidis]|nr:hypothetical protein O5D80_007679 [Batrachochytrium dendrobatidis]
MDKPLPSAFGVRQRRPISLRTFKHRPSLSVTHKSIHQIDQSSAIEPSKPCETPVPSIKKVLNHKRKTALQDKTNLLPTAVPTKQIPKSTRASAQQTDTKLKHLSIATPLVANAQPVVDDNQISSPRNTACLPISQMIANPLFHEITLDNSVSQHVDLLTESGIPAQNTAIPNSIHRALVAESISSDMDISISDISQGLHKPPSTLTPSDISTPVQAPIHAAKHESPLTLIFEAVRVLDEERQRSKDQTHSVPFVSTSSQQQTTPTVCTTPLQSNVLTVDQFLSVEPIALDNQERDELVQGIGEMTHIG